MKIESYTVLSPTLFPEVLSVDQEAVSMEWFQSALGVLRKTFSDIHDALSTSYSATQTYSESPITIVDSDRFQFGVFWDEIRVLEQQGLLYETIRLRKEQIQSIKDFWSSYVKESKGKDPTFYADVDQLLNSGKVKPVEQGCGAAYFLCDQEDNPQYVIKPIDEDIYCLNNRKHYASPFYEEGSRVRPGIPLYRSAQTDTLCYLIAKRCGLEHTTPRTEMIFISHESFFDLSEHLTEEEKEIFLEKTGVLSKEKLCSIQPYIKDSRDLYEVIEEYMKNEMDDDAIASHFDQQNFEDVNLFLWLSYDNDAHSGNFRVYLKRYDELGQPVYGIQKIDNGLSFPEINCSFINILTFFPNARKNMSESLKEKILRLPTELILEDMHALDMDPCRDAFMQRVHLLKELSQRDGISLYEVNLRLFALEMQGGKEIAFSSLSLEELEKLFFSIESLGSSS